MGGGAVIWRFAHILRLYMDSYKFQVDPDAQSLNLHNRVDVVMIMVPEHLY